MEQCQIKKKRALILEDEPAIARACQKVLANEGFEADIAADGLIAMKMVEDNIYDLCLSDIRMPGIDGIDFYRYLKKVHPDLAHNVIFTTGDVLNVKTDAFVKEVERPILTKPFTTDELKQAIRTAFPEET